MTNSGKWRRISLSQLRTLTLLFHRSQLLRIASLSAYMAGGCAPSYSSASLDAEPSGDLFAPPKFIAIVMIKRRSSLRHAAMQTGNEGAHGCPGATGGIFGSPEDRFSARRRARCHLFTAKRFAPKPRNRVIPFPIKRPYSRRTERREERGRGREGGREGGEGKDDMAQINAS